MKSLLCCHLRMESEAETEEVAGEIGYLRSVCLREATEPIAYPERVFLGARGLDNPGWKFFFQV